MEDRSDATDPKRFGPMKGHRHLTCRLIHATEKRACRIDYIGIAEPVFAGPFPIVKMHLCAAVVDRERHADIGMRRTDDDRFRAGFSDYFIFHGEQESVSSGVYGCRKARAREVAERLFEIFHNLVGIHLRPNSGCLASTIIKSIAPSTTACQSFSSIFIFT